VAPTCLVTTSTKCSATTPSKTPLQSDHPPLFQIHFHTAAVAPQSLLPLASVAELCSHICFVVVLVCLSAFIASRVIVGLAVLFGRDCRKCFRLCICFGG